MIQYDVESKESKLARVLLFCSGMMCGWEDGGLQLFAGRQGVPQEQKRSGEDDEDQEMLVSCF